MTGRGRGKGERCAYCPRILESTTARSRAAASRDHVVPKSKGGIVTVWACVTCNNMKADKSPEEWQQFMQDNPKWWKERSTSSFMRLRTYNPDPELVLQTQKLDDAMRVIFAYQDWPWLRNLILQRISQVGFGPWGSV